MIRRFLFACVLLTWVSEHGSLSAEHPRLPAFERFFSEDNSRDLEAGSYLLGELSCVKCHTGENDLGVLERTAPILDGVGSRVQLEHLRAFIADPQLTKPGTLMPAIFAGFETTEREQNVEALVHFLATTGSLHEVGPNAVAVGKGEKQYHTLGCVACHGSRKEGAPDLVTSVPLGKLDTKYSIPSLTEFLKDPHATRPSGRMPSLNLKDEEARELANYFLREVDVPANIAYKVYEGSWDKIPDFTAMKPIATGTSTGFDLDVAGKTNNFGIRFEGYLQIESSGKYDFELGSDDGSKLWIDGEEIVDVDGIHPHSLNKTSNYPLKAGPHHVVVDYFQGGGEWTLEAKIKGPKTPLQSLESMMTLGKEKPAAAPEGFRIDRTLVEKGRALFTSVGCANCHQLEENDKPLASTLKPKPLDDLNPAAGCLANNTTGRTPHYSLSERQIVAISSSLKSLGSLKQPEGEHVVFRTMATFNCYACHDRNGIGGVEREREAEFQGTIPEMGDEGRIPPSLTGAGDKLNDNWLKHILNQGASDRPYMLTRMPKFGVDHVSTLLTAFPELDRQEKSPRAELSQPEYRIKSEGRMMVGEKGMSCVKCHPFGNSRSSGIQALNLQSMTNRLREDWFNRYMINPQKYRRGTRMPTAWPNGRTILPDVLDGDTRQQLTAMWLYLADGPNAAIPLGLGGQSIVLEPKQKPIIYRNFLEGHSSRGIAIGYPEEAHLTFDAERFGIRYIWHGAFIDAARHWEGRGQGNQTPLGDHLVKLVEGIPFANLESLDTKWPDGKPRESGFHFRGYTLNEKGQPRFRYSFGEIEVIDFPQPVNEERDATFKREISLVTKEPVPLNLYFRIAAGDIEKLSDELFQIDGILRLKVPSKAVLRESGGRKELLIPVAFEDTQAKIVVDYLW